MSNSSSSSDSGSGDGIDIGVLKIYSAEDHLDEYMKLAYVSSQAEPETIRMTQSQVAIMMEDLVESEGEECHDEATCPFIHHLLAVSVSGDAELSPSEGVFATSYIKDDSDDEDESSDDDSSDEYEGSCGEGCSSCCDSDAAVLIPCPFESGCVVPTDVISLKSQAIRRHKPALNAVQDVLGQVLAADPSVAPEEYLLDPEQVTTNPRAEILAAQEAARAFNNGADGTVEYLYIRERDCGPHLELFKIYPQFVERSPEALSETKLNGVEGITIVSTSSVCTDKKLAESGRVTPAQIFDKDSARDSLLVGSVLDDLLRYALCATIRVIDDPEFAAQQVVPVMLTFAVPTKWLGFYVAMLSVLKKFAETIVTGIINGGEGADSDDDDEEESTVDEDRERAAAEQFNLMSNNQPKDFHF